MNANTETVRLLMEVGLLAASTGLADKATKIFDGIHAVRPESELPLVGRSIAQIHAGLPADAADTLEAALRINANSEFAKSYLGMAMLLSGRPFDAKSVLNSVVTEGHEASTVALARTLLKEASRD